jgi:ribosomal protein L37AE/L43A
MNKSWYLEKCWFCGKRKMRLCDPIANIWICDNCGAWDSKKEKLI